MRRVAVGIMHLGTTDVVVNDMPSTYIYEFDTMWWKVT